MEEINRMRIVVKTFRELTAEEFFRICEVREQVIGFYEKLGFHVTSELFDECGILHKTMEIG